MRLSIITFILSFAVTPLLSQNFYDYNSRIRRANQLIYALRPVSAENFLDREEMINPNNAYIYFYRLYNEAIMLLVSNSPERYKKSLVRIDTWIEKLQDMPQDHPGYRLLLGEARIYSGLLRVKYDGKFAGLLEYLRGFKLIESNQKEYPDYYFDNKLLGISHIATAFMPKTLRFGAKMLGINPDPVIGLKELDTFTKFARGKEGMEEEAFLLTMVAYKMMGQDEMVVRIIRNRMNSFKDIALLNYLSATICLESNQGELALTLLSNIKPANLEIPFPSLYYLTGKAKLYKLDSDADESLELFLKTSEGPDFMKATLYLLAISSLVSDNMNAFHNYLAKIKEKGRESTDRDIEAAWEAENFTVPDIHLLRAGLLIRGGYAERAGSELSQIQTPSSLPDDQEALFYFLTGEYQRLQGKYDEAGNNYERAIAVGKGKSISESHEAMIQLALIQERQGIREEAKKFYRMATQYRSNNNPYIDLSVNKAKAGIIRLSQSLPDLVVANDSIKTIITREEGYPVELDE